MKRKLFLAAAAAAVAVAAPAVAAQQDHNAATDAAPAVAGQHAHSAANSAVVDVARNPADLPGPLERRGPQTVRVSLETVEVTGQLADGSTYHYWTFNRRVPGPFIRVRVGDTVEVNLDNAADSVMAHNVDFHAVTGPGGGGVATLAAPGESKGFTFRALNPGLYVYHCATPMVAQHIANGMYGMILVEPEEGLPAVDREYYVMQGEIYTEQAHGTPGELTESIDKLIAEQPEYMVFNGTTDALSRNPLRANVGETVRIFFGVGGPNRSSSFHVIGEIFDRAWPLASITSPPMTDVQTILVPPGGAAVTDFRTEVPGRFMLVDHALSRLERGLVGHLVVEGEERAELYRAHQAVDPAASGH